MKVLSDILHKAGILKENAETYSSGGYSVLVRNSTTQRLETVASTAFANIYTSDGSLTANRTVTMGAYTLSFEKDLLVNGLRVGKGYNNISTNTVLGVSASGNALTTSQRNVFIGYQSAQNITSGSYNVAVGQWSLNLSSTSDRNTAVGYSSLDRLTGGNENTAVGMNASYELQTGLRNIAIGYNSGRGITTGSYNTIIGAQTVSLPSTLSNNIILADGQGNIRIRAFDTGNVTINSNTDAGYKLDVTGVTRSTTRLIAGSFNPGVGLLDDDKIITDGNVRLSGQLNFRPPNVGDSIFTGLWNDGQLRVTVNNGGIASFNYVGGNNAGDVMNVSNGFNAGGGSSGDVSTIGITSSVVPQGATSVNYNMLWIRPSINQFNLGTGSIRGVYYSPSITTLNGSAHYAWENTVGDIKFGNLSGTGSRMVVADSSGVLTTQAIPSSTTPTLAQVTTAGDTTTNSITVQNVSATGLIVSSGAIYTNVGFYSNNNGNLRYTFDTNDLVLRAGLSTSNEYVRVFGATGNVAIGTTTDGGQRLQVAGVVNAYSGSALPAFFGTNLGTANWINGTSSTWYAHIGHNSQYTGFGTVTGSNIESSFTWFYNGNAANGFDVRAVNFGNDPRTGTSLFTVRQGGNVGIGTTIPDVALQISNTNGLLTAMRLVSNAGGTAVQATMQANENTQVLNFGTDTNHPILFRTNTNERVRISTDGRLLVGTSTDVGTLVNINGAATIGGMVNITNSTGLPTGTSSTLFMASGFSSPDIGRIFIGDGTGWRLQFSKRASSTTTDLITFFDNGSIQTVAPTGYTAKPWKLGDATSGTVTPDYHIKVEIDGQIYSIPALQGTP